MYFCDKVSKTMSKDEASKCYRQTFEDYKLTFVYALMHGMYGTHLCSIFIGISKTPNSTVKQSQQILSHSSFLLPKETSPKHKNINS